MIVKYKQKIEARRTRIVVNPKSADDYVGCPNQVNTNYGLTLMSFNTNTMDQTFALPFEEITVILYPESPIERLN